MVDLTGRGIFGHGSSIDYYEMLDKLYEGGFYLKYRGSPRFYAHSATWVILLTPVGD
jgi:hypothetical protein